MISGWRKSSHSGGATDEACVEVARLSADVIGIRDGKDAGGPRLAVSPARFGVLLREIKCGRRAGRGG